MARAASNRLPALALSALLGALGALGLPKAPLLADFSQEERTREARRRDEDIWREVFGKRVVEEARRQLGRPYVWGEKSGVTGFDCSGFTAYVYRRLGVPLAPSAWQQFQQGVGVDKGALEPGDLVFFLGKGSPLHVGIYEGEGRFLHAPGSGKVIKSSRLDEPYFTRVFAGARRMIPALDEERRRRAEGGAAPKASPASALPNP